MSMNADGRSDITNWNEGSFSRPALKEKGMKKIISISGMSCNHCVAHVEKALKGVPGADKVKVDLKKNLAELKADGISDEAIKAAISEAGYEVTAILSA